MSKWIDKEEVIKLVYETYGMDISKTWDNHWKEERAATKIHTNTIVSLTKSEAKRIGVDWDSIAPSHRTKYLFRRDSVLEYFRTHGRR